MAQECRAARTVCGTGRGAGTRSGTGSLHYNPRPLDLGQGCLAPGSVTRAAGWIWKSGGRAGLSSAPQEGTRAEPGMNMASRCTCSLLARVPQPSDPSLETDKSQLEEICCGAKPSTPERCQDRQPGAAAAGCRIAAGSHAWAILQRAAGTPRWAQQRETVPTDSKMSCSTACC